MAILFINLRILIAKFDNAKTNIFRRGFWTNKVYIERCTVESTKVITTI